MSYGIIFRMVYAILSDIHANESALRHVLADIHTQGVDRIICLGDTVGYGPLPEESIRLLRAQNALILAGNHDDAVSGRIDPSDFNDLAADAVQRHHDALSSDSLKWLAKLPYTHAENGFLATHGDFTEPNAFLYIESEADAQANFAATDAQLMFVGHTHTPELFLTGSSGAVYRVKPTDFTLEDGKRYIVNPGSVGYPRETDGSCRSSYVIYDSNRRTIVFRFIPFSVSSVLQRGQTKKSRRALWLSVFTAAFALTAAAFWLVSSQHRKEPDLVIRADTFSLTGADRNFLPNLQLEPHSAPAVLKWTFRDVEGHEIKHDALVVKSRRIKPIRVPPKTRTAEVALLKESVDAQVLTNRYNPVFQP